MDKILCYYINLYQSIILHSSSILFGIGDQKMTGSLSRGAPTFNSMFFKPMMRKSYHKKGGGGDMIRGETVKSNAEQEGPMKSKVGSENDGNSCWIPHDRTGIYYPKGHEKVMEDVPVGAAKHFHGVHWFSNNNFDG
ncbi:hypothetical protein ACOSP7_021158 [Xanthoceras sorbifolium]|uniref:Uncharacterized protein n=1 Tax=Xanthoceras sorbifolium TaxID=99658 RepID=A0ABQ8HKQ6_9ROSI|nr:hypothetical protein JRO89_XS09G0075700 [Xanthoceras sorbifolium]